MYNNIKIIAHRSGPTNLPEQTVASAKLAMQNHADLIEIDLRLSEDGIVIVSHDADTHRVFGVAFNTAQLKAEEFKQLTHRDKPKYHGQLFEDYLKAGIQPLLLHIKEAQTIKPASKLLRQYGYGNDDIVFGVSSVDCIIKVKECFADAKILAFMPNPDKLSDFENAGVDYVRFWESWLKHTPLVSKKPIWIMTDEIEVGVTTPEKLKSLTELPIDGILINDITKL